MANILCAPLTPPFGWHYSCIPFNEDVQPNIKHESALKQPETIKIRWDVPDSSRSGTGQTIEVSSDIIPNQGLFGCEFAMTHTFSTFEKLIKSRLDENSRKFVEQLYDLMGHCFQGKFQTKWYKVITVRFLRPIGAHTPSLRHRETTLKWSPKLRISATVLSGSFHREW